MATCSIEGCGRDRVARGWCRAHWKLWRRNGAPVYQESRPRTPAEVRFWAKVDRSDGCWLWTGSTDAKWGYGFFRVTPNETMKKAHRVSWEIAHGPIPPGLVVCHTCDNPPCVRPDHLFLGTPQDNVDDRVRKGRSGRSGPGRGEDAPNAHLNEMQVRAIRERYTAGGISQTALGDIYGVSQTQISRITRGVRWGHIA